MAARRHADAAVGRFAVRHVQVPAHMAVLGPLPHIALHVLQAVRVRAMRAEGLRRAVLDGRTQAVFLVHAQPLLCPVIGRAGVGIAGAGGQQARGIGPFRIGGQAQRQSGTGRQPRGIVLRIVPVDADRRQAGRRRRGARRGLAAARLHAAQVFSLADLPLHDPQALREARRARRRRHRIARAQGLAGRQIADVARREGDELGGIGRRRTGRQSEEQGGCQRGG
ncbi:hypothetical protein BER2_3253 [plant metagenome]|uniref:Uncharacterized protein n=1 Tax=plant metagenome TaxID=1297885 RepID=A0A484QRH0_9ZZZZ